MSFSLDIKYAARLLFKKPLFTLLTVMIVAIGLGLTLYTYSLLNHLIFSPLTLNNQKPVIAIEAEFDYDNMRRPAADPIDLFRVKSELDLFDGFGIYSGGGTALISGSGKDSAARKFNSTFAQWNIFQFAGVQPILGRGLQPEDHFEGAEPVIVLGYKAWKSAFSADKDIIGTMIRVEAKATRVIGVMPEGFAFPAMAETWQPISYKNLAPTERQPIYGGVFAYARLKDGVNFKQLEKELANLNQKIVQTLPEVMKFRANSTGGYLKAYDYKKVYVLQHYPIFISMFVVVFLILLLACINISNLLLARVNERLKEIAIRIALGVPRARLLMQMLWESIFICGVGGFLALLIAGWGLELSNGVFEQMFAVNQQQPFWWQVSLDSEAIVVLILAILIMIVFTGLWPALRAMSGDFNAILRDGTRGAISKKSLRMNKVIVVTEVFLSCTVLVIATILLSTTYSAGQADYGVDTEQRLTAQIELPFKSYPVNRRSAMEAEQHKKRLDFFSNLKNKLEQLPNVNAVAFMRSLPGTGGGTKYVEIEGREAMTLTENPSWNIDMVAIDSWEALGIKLIAGRDFDYRDNSRRPTTSIISESLAKKYFPEGDAIGKRTRTVGIGYDLPWQTIVGIVSDVTHGSAMDVAS
ncbi:MAG: ABC transporter permease, partial [Colwellia sp.]|nr:ABC transporter permease [Colwellia sp.]